ncbi:MAG: hypothetical protein JW990_15410 [Thermoleophilia bacterium]|nr:hypothetical protein [Thermoleophilia bacterium]
MIDTHSHLLPLVDHGCPDLETCLEMAREAADSGVRTVVCTPHFLAWNEAHVQQIRETADIVRVALARARIPLDLAVGFEVDASVIVGLDTRVLPKLTFEGPGNAILLEVPYSGWPVYMEDVVFRLSAAGFQPVLAHPERNDRIQRSSEPLVRCLKAGAVAQGTAASLTGEFGRAAVQTFRRLMVEGAIRLLGSDAHAYRRDGWTLRPMLAALEGLVGPDVLATLVEGNPRRLLAGEPLLPVAAAGAGVEGARRRNGWKRTR